jgi:hypothetical protein
MCFKKLNIALPESMTRKGPGKKQSENPQEEGVVEEEEVEDNGGQNDRTVTYDLVRGEVVSLLSMASEAMNNRLQMLDSLITDAADGAKFMESLPQEKMKEMLLCMHDMTLTDPLTIDKKDLLIRKRLACEFSAKMKGESADKCAQES